MWKLTNLFHKWPKYGRFTTFSYHWLPQDYNCHCTVNCELCISTEELEKLHSLPQTVYTPVHHLVVTVQRYRTVHQDNVQGWLYCNIYCQTVNAGSLDRWLYGYGYLTIFNLWREIAWNYVHCNILNLCPERDQSRVS